ncbi:PilW family protein [Aquabacterium sp.]|uniref:PilW family protein n=1 Tax=Aquabacterium sp. TaxID=1872578 RepID=UPI003783D7FA
MPMTPRHQSNAGLSIVELLVGIAVGMFVLAGATMVTTNQMVENRRLLLETQIQQDLRAAMDIIARDIRRSGYWGNSYTSIAPTTGPVINPYSPAGAFSTTPDIVSYTLNRETVNPDDNVVSSNEQNGFVFNSGAGTIDVQLGAGNYQALTDPSVVRITQFSATVNTTPLDLPVCASPPCAMTAPVSAVTAACGGKSRALVRDVTITIVGEAVHDPSVRRSLESTVRVRNDQVCQ